MINTREKALLPPANIQSKISEQETGFRQLPFRIFSRSKEWQVNHFEISSIDTTYDSVFKSSKCLA